VATLAVATFFIKNQTTPSRSAKQMLTSWWARRDDSRCWRSLSSGTASAHTTATSLPTAIMTLVWYTTFSAASVEVNVTSCLYPSSATHLSASACKLGDVPSWHYFQLKQRTRTAACSPAPPPTAPPAPVTRRSSVLSRPKAS